MCGWILEINYDEVRTLGNSGGSLNHSTHSLDMETIGLRITTSLLSYLGIFILCSFQSTLLPLNVSHIAKNIVLEVARHPQASTKGCSRVLGPVWLGFHLLRRKRGKPCTLCIPSHSTVSNRDDSEYGWRSTWCWLRLWWYKWDVSSYPRAVACVSSDFTGQVLGSWGYFAGFLFPQSCSLQATEMPVI